MLRWKFAHLLLVILVGSTTANGAIADEVVSIQWRVPREQVAALRDELRLNGTITPDSTARGESKGLPLFYIFAGIVTLPSLVRAINTAVRDTLCGGVVIEATDEGLMIRCERSLGVGTVVVRSSEGVKIEQIEEGQGPAAILEALSKLRG